MNIIEVAYKWHGGFTKRPRTDFIALHHAEAVKCTPQDIHSWHVSNGWTGIGYHFFVRKDGTIYRGRPENAIGAHVSGANTNTLGICAEGSYMTEIMPTAQLNAIKWLIQYLDNKYGQLPIYGHREVGSSNCPGTNYPLAELKARKGIVQTETKVENVVVTTHPITETKSNVQKAKEYVGSRCKELQEKLILLGYNCGGYGADSQFGQGTYNSLVQFQKDNGLDPDGLAGIRTFAKLDELIAKKSSNSGDDWVRRLQQECNNQGFSNQKVDGIAGANTLNGCPTLRQGASGNITKLLQEKLVSLGYSTNGIDGIYGSGTANAVKSYQSSKGLSQDGVCGQATWRKLLGL